MICPVCMAAVPEEDQFCETCGARLGHKMLEESVEQAAAEAPLCACGAVPDEVDEEGFCLGCGKRVRRPASDHLEARLSADFAAVSDRGLRHDRNEDRFALVMEEQGYGAVICDGVSTTRQSEVASAIVAEGVGRELAQALRGEAAVHPEDVLVRAIQVASRELTSLTGARRDGSSPSTTVVAALVCEHEVTCGWAGDSRAYWIDGAGAHALTRDHSWVNEVLAAGEMSEEEAKASPEAHAITRWVGADSEDSEDEVQPEILRFPLVASGMLVLCSDGLWNYVQDAAALFALVTEASGGGAEALSMARRLVDFAVAQGGQDNVTVAILRVELLATEMGRNRAAEQSSDSVRKEDSTESEGAYGESVQG